MATTASARPAKSAWRSVLAALISLALVLSFFHGWSYEGDGGFVTVATASTSCDISGKAPGDPAATLHGDHCLSHVTTVAPQDSAVAIDYVSRPHRLAAMLAPATADLTSPFKPPRV
ncbi:hypothetical protein [Bradyrhizobium lablabi]|uniref:hypothetical protein n=1 Tax=Bradyrhizobium lablabi TaxID=722472 RepID=UPI001BAC1E08|nr:hypothetical protein [Bradyrhizobium lablabi]MBR0696391.1 hypothetical protein [Bradyrhizobium lablabi]